MKKYLRSLLFCFSLLISQSFMAQEPQKLYWVGGSGNFNDAAHWSLTSGGTGGAKSPTATDDVYFDENSFVRESIISFIGNSQAHDFGFAQYTQKVILEGMQHERVTISGNLQLNSYINNSFAGDIWLTSNEASTSVYFSVTNIKSNIYFNGNTQWNIQGSIVANDNATVYFKQGTFNLTNTSINSGNLVATAGVTINSNQTTYRVSNKFVLPSGVVFNDTKSVIRAYTKDPSKFQVSPDIVFNTNSRLNNLNNVMSCNITQTGYTSPTCAGACNATVTFTIPAACAGSSNPVWAVWTDGGALCNPPVTTSLTPGSTYTVGGICGCGTSYQILFTNDPATEDSSYALTGLQIIGGNQISITDPNPPQIQNFPIKIQPTCFGLCNGEISMQITTGTGTAPLSSTWTLPSGGTVGHTNIHDNTTFVNKDTLKNACAGTYSVFLTDAHGCVSATSTVTLGQPTKVVSAPTFTNPLCSGVCDGVIQDNPSGGTGAFTCTMDSAGGAGSNLAMPGCTVSGLCAGTYTVFATDAHGCKDTNIVSITPPPAITFVKTPASGILNIPCQNACNGSIGVTNVTGGTGAYTFSWTPAVGTVTNTANSSTYFGLCGSVAGIGYTCTITDANNCTKTATFTVKSPPALTLTPTHTNPLCNVGSTGSASVTATGGSPAYTFTWTGAGTVSGASPKSIDSNIPGGTYTVYTTDANGCEDSASVTLTPPPALTGTMTTIVNPTCPNLNNGHMCVTAGGGSGPYTYTWSPNPPATGTGTCTPNTLTVTPGGTSVYNVTITDAHSCTLTISGTLVSPPVVTVTTAITSPPCAGPCNGSATLTPVSGGGSYTYNYSCSGSTIDVISGQCGGTTCNYTVTDGNSCKTNGSVSFTLPTPLTLSLTPTALLCAGNCNAQINSAAGGGTGTYTYTWAGPGVCVACPNQINMCTGNYTCTIKDGNGCTLTATTSISAPAPISMTLTPTNPTCSGLCNGSILAIVTGGTAPLTHTWTSTVGGIGANPPNTLNPNNLCAGTYTLNVTDANGCTDSDTITLVGPPPVTILLTTTSVTCSGQCNGTASVTASGGSGVYSYSWDNAAFGALTSLSNLCAGSHTITVKDNNNCFATPSIIFTITQPTPLNVSVKNLINTCNGLCNGGATANITGGTPPYQFSWDVAAGPFSLSDSIISTLCVGTHTLFVKDANGCLGSDVFNIVPVVNISISVSSNTVSCHNFCDAIGTAQASGSSNAPYTIQWVGITTCTAVPASSPCIASGLCSGTHTIIATDTLGCSSTTTITIVNPPSLTVTAVATTPVSCFGLCTGSATITPSGGTPNPSAPLYSINWNPDPPVSSTVTTASNLCPGTYTANITDHNGCTFTQTVNIAVSGQFVVTNTLTAPSTCGANDGSISITVSGGSGTYTVNWAAGGTSTGSSPTFTYSHIPAGSYTATINDANGCDTTIVYGLGSPTGPVINYTVTNASCFGTCDGSATVVATGVNPNFTVIWSGGVPTGTNSITATNLCGGNPISDSYLVQATDAIGCITFTTVPIGSPSQILAVATSTNPTCGGSNGVISLVTSGGSGAGYSYGWNGGVSSFTNNPETGLSAGVDTVIITDGAGCTQQYTYTLTSTGSPSVTVNTSSVTCSYLANGTATATVNGGTAIYSYTWTNSLGVVASGPNIANVANLPAGNYSLTVSDHNNCTAQTTFTVIAPNAINPQFSQQNVLCNAGSTGTASVNPTGGTPAYTYTWSTGPTTQSVTTLFQGNYNVIVEDANTCTDTVRFTISQPTVLSMTVTSTPPTCFGGTNGSATVTVSGGTPFAGPIYTYTWSNSTFTPTTSNLGVGCYTITVADSNSCATASIVCISSPTQISPTITPNNPTCGGTCNGSIVVSSVSGGTGTYTFSWTPVGIGTVSSTATSSTYSNLCANSFTLIVTDANNCSVTTPAININAPVGPSLTFTTSPAICGASPCNGSITITSTTGTGTVAVNWLSPASCGSALSCNTLCAGTYSIQLTDASLCVDTVVIPLSNSNGPVVVSSFTNVTCNGSSNGAAFDTVISGNSPYTFSWTPSVTTTSTTTSSLNSGLSATNYFLIITDITGCITVTNFTITQPSPIQDAPTVHAATCLGINNGSITSNGSGGTPGTTGYQYSIDNLGFVSSGSFVGLSAGSHTVCIEDSLNCTKCFIYNISTDTTIVSSILATNATCFGTFNGTATVVSIGGGAPPYVVTWSDPGLQVGTTAINLCAGTYTALITDNVGCQANDTITVTSPNTINPNSVITPPSCGQCNGAITITPSGGNGGAYTFTWTPSSNASTVNNVCAGVYQVGISDNLACEQTFIIPVSSLNSPTITPTVTNVTCSNLCNGSITTSVTGGAIPYTYLWPIGTQTTSAINNQCPGNYIVEVKDSLGCIATQSVTIDSGIKIKPNITVIAPFCGVCNGTINTNVTGGSGAYTYSWSPNASSSTTTATITPVCAGLYTLVVTNSGCSDTAFVNLNSSSGPSITYTATNANCFGVCNGSATVVATGINTPIQLTWLSTNQTATGAITVNNLCGDSTYNVQVTDAAFCVQNAQITITQPTKLDTGLSTVTPIQCFNNTNGAINTVIFGGTPAYTYSWTPATIVGSGGTNLPPGTYSAIVTDANGCSINVSNTLTNPPLLTITGTFTNATCNNVADGSITTNAIGGTPTYTYQWGGGSSVTTPSLSAILPGNYSVTVTDSRGCTATNSFTVISTVTVTTNAGRDTTLCTNASVVLNGTVTGAATFDWQTITGTIIPPINTLTVSVNPATTTQYVLLAVNGTCRDSDTVTVFIASLPVANAGPSQSIFIGQTATIGSNPSNPSGGTMVWYPNSTLSDSTIGNPISSPTVTTTYTLVVTNSVGCKATDTMIVTILPPFTIPTGFTPNGDGKNDSWMIDGINQFPNVVIEVYNRWGEQLFYSKGNYTPWMGTYNGKPVPVGTYYYAITLNDPRYPTPYVGPLTILR